MRIKCPSGGRSWAVFDLDFVSFRLLADGVPAGSIRKCIGGDYFGNYEGKLPKKSGRKYYECDIDTKGASSRGAKRIIFSNDGLIFYTDDHYETFTQLY